MAAEDELALPQVPEARPNDPEDVSWALSTAEAMWARGDHLEGIKWVRKAAEAASEVEDDERALELAKAASELATIVARRSLASINEGAAPKSRAPGLPGGTPELFTMTPPTSGQPVSAAPTTTRSHAPTAPVPSAGLSSRPPAMPSGAGERGRSSPPIPLPSRVSQPPRSPQPAAGALSGSAPPRALATGDARQGPLAGRGILSNRTANEKVIKARRRSRENLDNEAKAAGVVETAPQTAVDSATAERVLRTDEDTAVGVSVARPVSIRSVGRPSHPDGEPTIVGRHEDLHHGEREKSAEEWDASPTQNLTGDDMDQQMAADGDRKTTAFAIPAAAPVLAAPLPPIRGPQVTVHDPEIQTTQAVRVIVWRDANGVHVAPAGTVVSAIKIDAVLVVLDEGADLTAWLSQRER